MWTGQIAIPLKVLNRRLTGSQRGNFSLQGVDVLDFVFELGDFALQKTVARLLGRDLPLVPGEHRAADNAAQQRRKTQLGEKLFFLLLARRLSVRQKVDQNHWWNLRSARPVDVRYEGASRAIFLA